MTNHQPLETLPECFLKFLMCFSISFFESCSWTLFSDLGFETRRKKREERKQKAVQRQKLCVAWLLFFETCPPGFFSSPFSFPLFFVSCFCLFFVLFCFCLVFILFGLGGGGFLGPSRRAFFGAQKLCTIEMCPQTVAQHLCSQSQEKKKWNRCRGEFTKSLFKLRALSQIKHTAIVFKKKRSVVVAGANWTNQCWEKPNLIGKKVRFYFLEKS